MKINLIEVLFCEENLTYLRKLGLATVVVLFTILGKILCLITSNGLSIAKALDHIKTEKIFLIAAFMSFVGFSIAVTSQLQQSFKATTKKTNSFVLKSTVIILVLIVTLLAYNLNCQPKLAFLKFNLNQLQYYTFIMLFILLFPVVINGRIALSEKLIKRKSNASN